jgi:hypothetical protein
VRERRSPGRNGLECLTWYGDCWARWCQFWVSAKSRDARRRCLCCNRGPGRPTSGITTASATKRLTLKGRFPSQDRSASVRSMHSSPPTPRISAYCGTVRRLSHPVTTPSCPRSTCGGGEFSLRPLDPQDCGLGVSADPSGLSGGAVGVPTCWLSDWMHAVWSPDGPQDGTACMPYRVRLSVMVAHRRKSPSQRPRRGSQVQARWGYLRVSRPCAQRDA